ncbi:DadA Glycine/D-amino acid oxidases (deaminating) [Caulobacteraceae bacterium]
MTLPRHPSIMIVGAGPVGLCTGIALLKDGHRVALVDSGAHGAGWASGGMLAPLYEMAADPTCPDPYVQFALKSAELWQVLAQTCAVDLQSPSLFLARTQEEVEVLLGLQQRANRLGLEVATVPVPAGLRAQAAFQAPSERSLDPRAALKSLMNQFQSLGGDLLVGQANAISPHRLGLLDGRTLEAETIVLAHGFNATSFRQSVPTLKALRPVKGQMARVAHPELASPIVRAGRIYVLSRSGGLVIGATSDPLAPPAPSVDVDPVLTLLSEAKELLPSLATAAVVEAWAGLRPDTPDHLPMVGASGMDGIYLATGTYRNGWLLAPAIGAYLTELISGKTLDQDLMNLFAPERFSS